MSFKEIGTSICKGLLYDARQRTSEDVVNVHLASLKYVASLGGAPEQYREHAARVECDGVWGKMAREAHRYLAASVDPHTFSGELYIAVRDYQGP